MQLRVARLCLDCEELHDLQQCPVCASESFGFISRWVPAPERRFAPRDGESPSVAARPSSAPAAPAGAAAGGATTAGGQTSGDGASGKKRGRTVAYGVVGLGLAGLAGWLWNVRRSVESAAERGAGELK